MLYIKTTMDGMLETRRENKKMASLKTVFFLSFFIVSILCSSFAQDSFFVHFCITKTGNYTNGSTYQKNLNNVLTSLPSKIDSYGYSIATFGQVPDRVNAVGLCRGDVDPDSCNKCLKGSIPMLTGLCPTNKDAVGWSDDCMLRYSSMGLTGDASISTDETFYVWSLRNVTSPELFKKDAQGLLEDLKTEAAGGGSRKKFGAGKKDGPDSQTIYAIVQCSPDLSEQQCSDCLARTFSLFPSCCDNRAGGRVITPNCNFRYEINLFYNQTNVQTSAFSPAPPPLLQLPSPPTVLQLTPPPPLGNGGNRKKTVSVSTMLFLILLVAI